MKTTIGIKIGFAFFVLLLLFGVIGTNIYYSVNDGMITLEQIKEEARKQIKVGNLRFKVTQVLMAGNDYVITNKEFYKQEYQKLNALLDKDYLDFIQSDLTDKEKQLAYEIKIDIDSIRIYSERIFSITNPRQSSYAWELMEIMDYSFGNAVNAKTTLIFDGVSERIEENSTNAEMAKQKIITFVQRTILISLIFSLIIIYLSIVKIARPIKKITEASKFIAKGDYTKRLEIKTHDEIASLADSFNLMSESIQQAQKALEDSKRLTETIVATAPAGLLVFDSKGKIMIANNSFCNNFNLVQNSLLYQNIGPMFEELKLTEECRSHILTREPITDVECSYSNPIKGLRIMNLTLYAIKLNNGESLLIIEDITERKQNEQELIKAKEKAESSNKLKDTFIANISHEIRTPLNGILGLASIISETYSQNILEDDKQLFDGIKDSSNRIIRTVDMILNYSRLQAGEFPISPKAIDIASICKKLVREFKVAADVKTLDLLFENKCKNSTVFADDYSLTQTVSNLIDNAIKYTKKGFVKLVLYKEGTDELMLDVQDSGIGIAEDYLNKVFTPYMQE